MISAIQKRGSSLIEFAGGFGNLVIQVFQELLRPPFYFRLVLDQIFFIGVKSFVLVCVTGLATGGVMALQFGFGLEKFGGTLYVPKITSLSILRELGPVFTSLLVAGRIGSGIAAEVSSMKVTQQIDAIRALGTSPIQRIVIPRVIACLITLPILTLFADYIALWGAMIVCKTEFGIGQSFFITKALETVKSADLFSGMMKTMVFAFFISITACWRGFNTEGGTEGVGDSTTWVVVASSIFILVSDFFLTKLFMVLLYTRV